MNLHTWLHWGVDDVIQMAGKIPWHFQATYLYWNLHCVDKISLQFRWSSERNRQAYIGAFIYEDMVRYGDVPYYSNALLSMINVTEQSHIKTP